MMTQSKCSFSECEEVPEALRAEQLRRIRRHAAGRQHPQAGHARLAHRLARLGVADQHVRQPGLLRAAEDLVHARPAHVGVDQQHALAGLRERRSPGCSRPCVLPSPGPVLVTTSDREPSSRGREQHVGADARGTPRRSSRGTPLLMSGCGPATPSRRAPASCRGTAARGARLISSGVLMRLSRYSKKNASPHARTASRRTAPSSRLSALRGLTGVARRLGRVDDADVARLQLAGDAGLLRPLHQALVDLLVALHVALEHAVVDAPCGSSTAPRPSAGSSAARQALLLRQRGLVLVAHRLHDLGDLALQLRLRLPESPTLQLRPSPDAGRRASPTAAPAGAAARPARSSAAG